MRKGETLSHIVKEQKRAFKQLQPEIAAAIFRWITEHRMKIDLPPEYIAEIAEAIMRGDPVFVLGPHYSVLDVGGFTVLISELNRYFEEKKIGIEECGIFWPLTVQMVGPASSKFVSTGDLKTRMGFEGSFLNGLQWLGLTLYPVIQVQDDVGIQALGQEGAERRNRGTWAGISVGLQEPTTMFGMFPEGTRAKGPGAARPPVVLCEFILKMCVRYHEKGIVGKKIPGKTLKVPVNPVIASFVLRGGHITWGMNQKKWWHKPELLMAKPMHLGYLTTLVNIVQHYLEQEESKSREFSNRPLHPVEAVYLVSLFNAPEEFRGVYAPAIAILRQLVISTTQNGTLDEFIDSLGSSEDDPSRASG